jgi:hypothetical protein
MEAMFKSGRSQVFVECVRVTRLKNCPESFFFRFNLVDIILVSCANRNLFAFLNMSVCNALHFDFSLNFRNEQSI